MLSGKAYHRVLEFNVRRTYHFLTPSVPEVFGNGSHGQKIYVIVWGQYEFYVYKNNNNKLWNDKY
jgi:hypothetical protein